jgi:hypothetical protein
MGEDDHEPYLPPTVVGSKRKALVDPLQNSTLPPPPFGSVPYVGPGMLSMAPPPLPPPPYPMYPSLSSPLPYGDLPSFAVGSAPPDGRKRHRNVSAPPGFYDPPLYSPIMPPHMRMPPSLGAPPPPPPYGFPPPPFGFAPQSPSYGFDGLQKQQLPPPPQGLLQAPQQPQLSLPVPRSQKEPKTGLTQSKRAKADALMITSLERRLQATTLLLTSFVSKVVLFRALLNSTGVEEGARRRRGEEGVILLSLLSHLECLN